MARTGKSVFVMVLTALLMLAGGTVWAEPAPPVVVARAAELVDATTGQVLFSNHAEQALPMASVTKLMTLYIAIRAKSLPRKDIPNFAYGHCLHAALQ